MMFLNIVEQIKHYERINIIITINNNNNNNNDDDDNNNNNRRLYQSLSKRFLFHTFQFNQTVLIQAVQFYTSTLFVHSLLNIKSVGALSRDTKGLLKGLKNLEIRGREESIQTTALLRSARILRIVLET